MPGASPSDAIVCLVASSRDASEAINDNANITHRMNANFGNGSPKPALVWQFGVQVKDMHRGFTFGNDRNVCDVRLASQTVGRRHFSIQFNLENGFLLVHNNHPRDLAAGTTFLCTPGDSMLLEDSMQLVCGEYKFTVCFISRGTSQKAYLDRLSSYLGFLLTNSTARVMTTYATPFIVRDRVGNFLDIAGLGGGAFGEVALFVNNRNGKMFAAKRTKKDRQNDSDLQKEISTLRKLDHPNIVKYEGEVKAEDGSTCLLMEYLGCGDIGKDLELETSVVIEMLHQCLQALAYVHDKGVIHRDIKPDNIMMHSRDPLVVKLADFGLAYASPFSAANCGTLIFSAPELFEWYGERGYDQRVDIWSLGVTTLQLLKQLPYREAARFETKEDPASQEAYILALHANTQRLSSIIGRFLQGMLQVNPKKRWTAKECLERIGEVRRAAGQPPPKPGNCPLPQHLQPRRVARDPDSMSWEPTPRVPQIPKGAALLTTRAHMPLGGLGQTPGRMAFGGLGQTPGRMALGGLGQTPGRIPLAFGQTPGRMPLAFGQTPGRTPFGPLRPTIGRMVLGPPPGPGRMPLGAFGLTPGQLPFGAKGPAGAGMPPFPLNPTRQRDFS